MGTPIRLVWLSLYGELLRYYGQHSNAFWHVIPPALMFLGGTLKTKQLLAKPDTDFAVGSLSGISVRSR